MDWTLKEQESFLTAPVQLSKSGLLAKALMLGQLA
jgi:hypothetical protein